MSKFKVGDMAVATARAYGAFFDVTEGKAYEVLDVDGGDIRFTDDAGDSFYRSEEYYEHLSRSVEFIINGCSELFTSQEDAENYATHSGMYTDGTTVEIAQVIRRAMVKRTVSATLETVE